MLLPLSIASEEELSWGNEKCRVRNENKKEAVITGGWGGGVLC